jgi:phosphoribosylformylglycinamidine synthase subunit PurSL
MDYGRYRPGPDIYRFIVRPLAPAHVRQATSVPQIGWLDPRSAAFLSDAHALGLKQVTRIDCADLFFIEGILSDTDLQRLAHELLSDRLVQSVAWEQVTAQSDGAVSPARSSEAIAQDGHLLEVALRPGVTDPVAEQIVRAAHLMGISGVQQASTGMRFYVFGPDLHEDTLNLLASRLLANPIIQWFSLGEIQPVFPQAAEASGVIETIAVRSLSEQQLLDLSRDRRAALDVYEMLAIQRYYRSEGREMTDIEFETIAQTWSEHCVHKTFRAMITVQNPQDGDSDTHRGETVVNNLLKTYLRTATEQINAPWVLSAFVDNAGILAFGSEHEVSFKVETHNHPSAIEPFGGANTGVGGVIRDVIGVSAKPIAATDVLCFGPQDLPLEDLPAGVLHPRRIRSGVVAGVQDYGNKIGIPTVSGAVLYDPGFTSNPLVFCGCVGIAPRGRHPRSPQPSDRVIVLGGRTGRDGLRGATFSSMTMDAQTGEVAGASVQIGAPITEKGLIDVVVAARDSGLYHAITDCGAGGLSSAVGEMSSVIGAQIDLASVRLKYPGLAPWEIWLSEAQERMVLALPQAKLPLLQALCRLYDVELTDIGFFTGNCRLLVRSAEQIVLDLSNDFLHEGIPQRQLLAELPVFSPETTSKITLPAALDIPATLLSLLAHPNIASKAPIIRIYDHEVQGGTFVKPLTGVENDGPADAVVIKPIGTPGKTALVLAAGINPEFGKRNPYRMAFSVIDEAIRNAVAVGADPDRIALLDNFCWGDPRSPATLGGLVECVRGCYDAALYYRTPFVSGKDSLNNEYLGKDGQRHAIPPTLLISALGIIDDYSHSVTLDLKQAGNPLYLLGAHNPRLDGSHVALVTGQAQSAGFDVPLVAENTRLMYQLTYLAMRNFEIRACHDLSEGGLAVTAAEMCMAGRMGMQLKLACDAADYASFLFGETNGCFLVEVDATLSARFEARFAGLPLLHVGSVSAQPILSIHNHTQQVLNLPVNDLLAAWQSAQ